MSLLSYIANPSYNFSRTEQRALANWYGQFVGDPALRLIQRNIDRECERDDIDHTVYVDYLRQLSWYYRANQPDPTDFMNKAYGAAPSRYLLPGDALPTTDESLARCMRLDHLVKYNLQKAAIPITYDMQGAISALRSGALNGVALIGSILGQQHYPVWVSPRADISLSAAANDVRDLLGLQHIQFGHLVELSYSQSILPGGNGGLRAPTVLDASAKGAENWVFVKSRGPGGPDWGYTVNLSSASAGVREAVHSAFHITSTVAPRIGVRYVDVITCSPPAVDYQQLIKNT